MIVRTRSRLSRSKFAVALVAVSLLSTGLHAEGDALNAAQALVKARQAEQAMAVLDAELAKTPGNFQLRYLKAISLLDMGRFSDAAGLFDGLIREAPQTAELYNNRGYARAQLKQYSLAMQDFEGAIQRKPEYVQAHENLGLLNVTLAEMALAQAARLDQDNPRIRARLAAIQGALAVQAVDAAAKPAVDRPVREETPASVDQPVGEEKPAGTTSPDAAAVGSAIEAWRAAWSGKDLAAYFSAYTPDFAGTATNAAEWRAERERKIAGKAKRISVELSDMVISFRDDGTAEASFLQTYRAAGQKFKDHKRLILQNLEGRWLIVEEKVKPVNSPVSKNDAIVSPSVAEVRPIPVGETTILSVEARSEAPAGQGE